ncbi:Zinc metalloproteinase nas-6 [Portunus trituberculatus]|uniref:Metalloendopeptidase n=1 Tax=Portunus trituberculatus TaxID=210409 RepID=A0A5B7GMU9_PORTR|nr:Zinc metalloproteinase nas-6 [Portunus trituberculatus]
MVRATLLLSLVSGWVLICTHLTLAGKRFCWEVTEEPKTSPTNATATVEKISTEIIPSPKSKPSPPKTTPSPEIKPSPKITPPSPKDTKKNDPFVKTTFPTEKIPPKPTPVPKSEPSPKPTTPFPPVRPDTSKSGDEELDRAIWEMNQRRWPNRTVPFVFHPKLKKKQIELVTMAMDKIRNLTCVDFTDLTGRVTIDDKQEHKVVVQTLYAGCFATLGYNKFLKTSSINLDRGCFSPSGHVILHELCHTLGIAHTQSRYDRDKYITVHVDKIERGKEPQFTINQKMYGKLSLVGLPYDFNSVMHYPTNAFAKDPKENTMTLKKNFPGQVGFAKRLTRSDVATINRLYDCKNHYLGDDIPEAKIYKEWYETYFA